MNRILIALFFLSTLFLSCSNKVEKGELPDGLYALIETSKGDITVKLEFEKVPFTVANFVTLAEGKNNYVSPKYKGIHFYDGLTFHRVESNPAMCQGGDPLGTGEGGPGYKFKDEFHPDLNHGKAGIISMAKSKQPNTNGSQFFITTDQTSFLDGIHSVFGEVVEGLDIVSTIAVGDPINKVKIIRIGQAAKKFDAVKVFKEYYEKQAELQKTLETVKAKKIALIQDIKTTGTKTKSGLIYKIVKSGGKKANAGQEVFVHYAGFLEDGTLFDTSYESVAEENGVLDIARKEAKQYIPFPFEYGSKTGLIAGFIEGLEKMNLGDKAVLIIPGYLGYGEQGSGPIPPNATIIFEIELLEKQN